MPLLRRHRGMVARSATSRMARRASSLDRILPMSALQQRGEAGRRGRSPSPVARVDAAHPRVSPCRRLWRASCVSDWARLARRCFSRPGRSGVLHRVGCSGRTQRRGAAHQAAVVLRGRRPRRRRVVPRAVNGNRNSGERRAAGAICKRLRNWRVGRRRMQWRAGRRAEAGAGRTNR